MSFLNQVLESGSTKGRGMSGGRISWLTFWCNSRIGRSSNSTSPPCIKRASYRNERITKAYPNSEDKSSNTSSWISPSCLTFFYFNAWAYRKSLIEIRYNKKAHSSLSSLLGGPNSLFTFSFFALRNSVRKEERFRSVLKSWRLSTNL